MTGMTIGKFVGKLYIQYSWIFCTFAIMPKNIVIVKSF